MPKIYYGLILLLLSLFYQTAFAEGVLLEAQPKDNAVIKDFNQKITLTFSGNISERTPTLVVVDSTGKRVDKKDVKLTIAARSLLTVSTEPLNAGRYAVRYRVVTEDGLIVSGITRFEIKP